jgi:hypothetical protein
MKLIIAFFTSCLLLSIYSSAYAFDLFGTDNITDVNTNKDMCLIFAKQCFTTIDLIQQQLKEIEFEIEQGTKNYKAEEITKIKDKLEEIYNMILELKRR